MITCHISVRKFDSCRGKYREGGNLVTPHCLLLTLSLGLHWQVVVGFVSPSVRDLFGVFSDCERFAVTFIVIFVLVAWSKISA